MVAWWPLDETSGPTANDIGGNVNNSGTWMNSPVPVTGKVGGALSFDGSNYVDVPDHPELNFGTGDLTVDAWIFPTDLTEIKPIVDKREDDVQAHGYTLFLYEGIVCFELAVDNRPNSMCGPGMDNACQNYSSGVSIPINTWTHVAVTVDRDEPAGGLFYVNGVNVASFNPLTQAGDISNTGDLWIGRRHPVDVASIPYYFNGYIDEVELFNRVLTPAEVQSIYQAGSDGKCKCATPSTHYMVAWWPLDDQTGATIVKDIAVVGCHPGTPLLDGAIGVGYSPQSVVGKVGDALYFWQNGVYRTYVSVDDQPDIRFGSTDFSIDAWVYITQYSGTDLQPIVEKMQYNGTTPELGYRFYLESGYLSFILAWGLGTATPIQAPFQISQAVWHHVAVTVDRDYPVYGDAFVSLYIDATLAASATCLSPTSIANTEALIMGAIAQLQPVGYLDIRIDELELFDSVLTDHDVFLIYQAGALGKCKAELCGMKFWDHNCNGMQDMNDLGLDNWPIFIDYNLNGAFDDPGEPYTTTDAQGDYCFTVPAPGWYRIREVNQSGWTQTWPDPTPYYDRTVVAYQSVSGLDFGNCGCEPCPNNIVQNWSFIDGAVEGQMPSPGETDHWTLAYGSPDVHVGNACCDPACVTMWGNQVAGEAIQQTLTFVKDRCYTIKFCAYWVPMPGRPYPVQFEFRASIIPLTGTGVPPGVVIGVSPPVTPAQQWMSMPPIKWKATDDYLILTVSATNHSSAAHPDSTSAGRIDRICIYEYIPGDVNGDGVIDLGDVLYIISYLYKGGPAPDPLETGDCNGDGVVDLGDVLHLINYLYKGGPAPGC